MKELTQGAFLHTSDSQSKLERPGRFNAQVTLEFDSPRRSQSRRQEIVQLDASILEYEFRDPFARGISLFVMFIERAKPARVSIRGCQVTLESWKVLVR